MDTILLLKKLKTISQNTPDHLAQVDWKDVALCVETEFSDRPGLYCRKQSNDLCVCVRNLCNEIQSAIRYQAYGNLQSLLSELIGIVEALPDFHSFYTASCLSRFEHEALCHYRSNTTIILGDSHVNFFSGNENLTFSPIGSDINVCPTVNGKNLTVLHLGPGLAYKSCMPDSNTRFLEKTLFLCDAFFRPGANIVISVGEIDIRVHVFKQSALQDRNVNNIIDDILDNYMKFLKILQAKGYHLYCWAPIATQSDNAPLDPDYPRNGTEIARNKATLYFSDRLTELCSPISIPVLSIAHEMIDPGFLTRQEFLSSDQVHLSQTAMNLADPQLQKWGLLS